MLPLLTALFRERAFYAERGLPCPKDMEAETEKDEKMKKVSTSFLTLFTCSFTDPDPGSVAFFDPGSGIRNRFFLDPGSQIPDP
jgi:hypothetical protein